MAHNHPTPNATPDRYPAQELIAFAARLCERVGLSADRAATMATILVEADLMGHTTHGLNLLAAYLGQLEAGSMTKEGDPVVLSDRGAAITWNGRYLPGPWLVVEAIKLACERIEAQPVVTVVIQQSHHIACLAAYPKIATDQGLLLLLACSDPNERAVAPFGGVQPLYTPNPIAAGIPTPGEPIIIDISMSTTALGLVGQVRQAGRRLPHPWLLDQLGNPTDDPAALSTDPPGSVLPLGGTDLGHKGYALGLLVEALTSALAGGGRSEGVSRWGASVFLQVIDPQAFGGYDHFIQETGWLADACRQSPPIPGGPPVRLPGSRALQRRAEQLERGVALYPTIMPALEPWAEKLGVPLPAPMAS